MTEIPPGWHPDPRGRHEHRYWDGSVWTDHVADNGVMSLDPVAVAPTEIAAPAGPSLINLPAIKPAEVQATPVVVTPEPAAAAAAEPAPAVSHREQEGPEDALESVADAFDHAAASLAHRPLSLAALLSVVAPGAGHLYLGLQGMRRTIGLVLLGVTVAAVVFSGYISYIIGLALYLAALAFALFDLRGELSKLSETLPSGGPLAMFSDLGAALAWRLVVVGGALMAISLVLPWYHLSVSGFSANASGFEAFSIVDLVLLVVGVAAAVLGVLNLQQGTPNRPVAGQIATVLAAAGAVCLALVVFRLLFVPNGDALDAGDVDVGRTFGALLAYASAVLLTGGAAGAAAAKS